MRGSRQTATHGGEALAAGGGVGGGVVVRFARRDEGDRERAADDDDGADGPEVRRHSDAPRRHRDADTCAGDRAEAEERMEERHDRAVGRLLDGGAFDVHHHVGGPHPHAHERESDRRQRERREGLHAESDDQDSQREGEKACEESAAGAPPREGDVGERQADDRGGARGEEQDADLEVVDPEPGS